MQRDRREAARGARGVVCSVDGCHARHEARGLCSAHYRRVRRHGTLALLSEPLVADRDKPIGYRQAHKLVEKMRGRAADHRCECGARARHWSLSDRSVAEFEPGRGPYSLDVDDYDAMCPECHQARDAALR